MKSDGDTWFWIRVESGMKADRTGGSGMDMPLPTISLLSSGSSSPTSTRSDAGWGISRSKGSESPDVHRVPTPPPAQMEPTSNSPVTPSPILSVNIPITAHHLCKESLNDHRCDMLHSLLYAPHLHHALEFQLKTNSPL